MVHACLDAAAALGIAEDEAVKSRILSYLAWCERTQVQPSSRQEVCRLEGSCYVVRIPCFLSTCICSIKDRGCLPSPRH